MIESVLEINGSNTYLKCTVCNQRPEEATSDVDELLLGELKVDCPRCISDPSTRRPGCLLSDILLDDEAMEVWGGNKRVDELAVKDSNCDMLLVLGPQLKSKGAAHAVRALADKVHLFGGTVIYVDWKILAPNVWGRYIDLHLEANADTWAENYLSNLSNISKVVSDLPQLLTRPDDAPWSSEEHAQEARENSRPKKKVKFTAETKGDSIGSHLHAIFLG
ncbi:hypothetical protein FRC10_002860 [Ceratobasidium sp. 414]|nr:hypothetical protein FRC10_002860 [Ceratobasidium sp. 414]